MMTTPPAMPKYSPMFLLSAPVPVGGIGVVWVCVGIWPGRFCPPQSHCPNGPLHKSQPPQPVSHQPPPPVLPGSDGSCVGGGAFGSRYCMPRPYEGFSRIALFFSSYMVLPHSPRNFQLKVKVAPGSSIVVNAVHCSKISSNLK